jgi:hypothetical protein
MHKRADAETPNLPPLYPIVVPPIITATGEDHWRSVTSVGLTYAGLSGPLH